MSAETRKVERARAIGSVYFIVLGLANIIYTAIQGRLHWKDFLILVLFASPLLVNKKIYYLLFGGASAILWVYAFYSVFHMHTLYVRQAAEHHNPYLSPAMAFTLGYLFTSLSAACSLLLLYVGTRPSSPSQR